MPDGDILNAATQVELAYRGGDYELYELRLSHMEGLFGPWPTNEALVKVGLIDTIARAAAEAFVLDDPDSVQLHHNRALQHGEEPAVSKSFIHAFAAKAATDLDLSPSLYDGAYAFEHPTMPYASIPRIFAECGGLRLGTTTG